MFIAEREKKRWTKRFLINVNEGLSQKKDFFSFLQTETGGQMLMLNSRDGSRNLPLMCTREKPRGDNLTAEILQR